MIEARPYAFPYHGAFEVERTLLVLMGFQAATLTELGSGGASAHDTAKLLAATWAASGGRIVVTRRGVVPGRSTGRKRCATRRALPTVFSPAASPDGR